MSEIERTPPWKSFLYAIAGAYMVYCSVLFSESPHFGTFDVAVMVIFGVTFWVGGTGNLLVDRRQQEARKT